MTKTLLRSAAALLASCVVTSSVGRAAAEVDYGADKVNRMAPTDGMKTGGADRYNYLALENHHGPSGVPVGGIGTGYFNYAPDGRFSRIAINAWHTEGDWEWTPIIKNTRGTFLALWENGAARVLQRGVDVYGMAASEKSVYRGLFPIAENTLDDSVKVRVWSSLIAHNAKDSSLPLAWVEVELTNTRSVARDLSVAFSWEDVIARQVLDLTDLKELRDPKDQEDVWSRSTVLSKGTGTYWNWMPRVATTAEVFSAAGYTGIRQYSAPLRPRMKTFQNYNNEIVIIAETQPDVELSFLPAYAVDAGDDAWAPFRRSGRFPPVSGSAALFDPANHQERASAVAASVILRPGESRTLRFMVAWFRPEIHVNPAADDPASFCGKADYNRYYHNSFDTLSALVGYAAARRERLLSETRRWQEPILSSSYPDWLKFKVINSGYTVYANTVLNKAGDFSVMEGGMGGLMGTMDQRISAHPFYQKFFPQLDRSELELFGHTADPQEGYITHFVGHYYIGMGARHGGSVAPRNWMLDNSGGWLIQVAKVYEQTGDKAWLEQFREQIPRTVAFLRKRVVHPDFYIIAGPSTYDDFWHPEIFAYNAGIWPSFLQAASILMTALGDASEAGLLREEAARAARDFERALWNGRFYAYGADPDGSNRRDDIMSNCQLAGQFVSRICGWDDSVPMENARSSLREQFKSNISATPDYYAPKVWDLANRRAMRDPRRPDDPHNDSTCWPFYLESYTAMAGIQAGYAEDGLEIMRYIQLVHLRNGWTWAQNLWRPGELTYMSAPVSWFITDVLAGASLDVPGKTLTLGPVFSSGESAIALPLYFPGFWAMLRGDRRLRTLTLSVSEVFGDSPAVIEHVRILPAGVPSGEARRIRISPFAAARGAVLDLATHFDDLTSSASLKDPVLKGPPSDRAGVPR